MGVGFQVAMSTFLPRSVRTIGRLQAVALVLTRHGFGHLVDTLNLSRYVPFLKRFRTGPAAGVESPHAIGHRLARVCEDLGPTYVKLAQTVASRPDLLPPEITAELRKLHDDVAPFATDVARKIIEEDLGTPVEEAFEHFTEPPLASGSIGQVYRAVTADGQQVVVKVLRPGIEEIILLDMHILKWLAERLERAVPDLAAYRPSLIVEEFDHTIQRELDFVNEAATTARFHAAFADDPTMLVPDVLWELTGTRVLTLTWIDGTPVQRLIDKPDPAIDNEQVAEHLTDAFLRQFFELGMFHADPHPGNLLISPPARIGLIDFGMVGQVDDELASQLAVILLATVNKEVDLIVDVLADLGAVGPEMDRRALCRSMRVLLEKYYGLPLKRLNLQTIFTEVAEVLRRNDVTLPRDFVLLGKSLVTVAGVGLQLHPELNLLERMRPRVSELLKDRLSPRRLLRLMGMSTWHILNIAKTGPRQLRDALRGLARGQWQINIRHQNLDTLANEVDRASNRMAFSIVIAATIMGSSMLVGVEGTTLFGLPISYLAVAGYIAAGMMGLGLVVAILRSGKLS